MSQKSRTQSVMGQNQITEGVIWKQLLLFFFPILFGTFFQQLYNTADAVIVGRFVGKEALAAVGGPRTFFRRHRNYLPVLRCETAGPGEQGGTYVNSIFHRGRHCPHGHRCGRRAVGLIRHGNTG